MSRGRKYDIPVVVGTLAASRQIYGFGLQCKPEEIVDRWNKHRAIPPKIVDDGTVHEEVRDRRSWTKGAWGNSRFPSRPRIRLRAVHYRLALVHPRSGNGPYQHRQLPRPYQKPDTNRCLSQFEQSRWISLAQVPGAGDPSSSRAGDRRAAAGILHGAGPHTVQRERT